MPIKENVNVITPINAKITDRYFLKGLKIRKQEKMTTAPVKRAIVILCVIFETTRKAMSIEEPIKANGLFNANTPF